MRYDYIPQGICAKKISFDIADDGTVHDLSFVGGCDGNHKAIARLVEGQPADKIAEILSGNTCGLRKTSCADQFAKGLMAAKEQMK